jgi:hypothetical protein
MAEVEGRGSPLCTIGVNEPSCETKEIAVRKWIEVQVPMARREVQSGQRYQQAESSSVWEVIDLTSDGEGIAHARLTRVGDPTAVKMISVLALKDGRLYKLLDE